MIETRYENMVRTNFEKMAMSRDVLEWSKEGFSTHKASRRRHNLDPSPEITRKIKLIANKGIEIKDD